MQRVNVPLQLRPDAFDGVVLAGRAHQAKQIVPATVFRDKADVLPNGLRPLLRQQAEDVPKHISFAQPLPDVAGVEQRAHGQIAVLDISSGKQAARHALLRAAQCAADGEEVETVASGGAIRHRPVCGLNEIRIGQHMHSSCLSFLPRCKNLPRLQARKDSARPAGAAHCL